MKSSNQQQSPQGPRLKAERIAFDHRLIEEAYQELPLNLGTHKMETAFWGSNHPEGQTELLTKQKVDDKQTRVSLLSRDQSSRTGWKFHPSDATNFDEANLEEFASFYYKKELFLFSISSNFPQNLNIHKRDQAGSWSNLPRAIRIAMEPFHKAWSLETGYTQTGVPYLTGLFSKSNNIGGPAHIGILYPHPENGQWLFRWLPESFNGYLRPKTVQIEIDQNSLRWNISYYISMQDKQVLPFINEPHGTGPIEVYTSTEKGLKGSNQVFGMQIRENSSKLDFFQLLGQKLEYIFSQPSGRTYQYEPLTGNIDGQPKGVCEVNYTELDGVPHLIVLDIEQSLWILKTGARAEGRFTRFQWIELGDRFRYLGVAPKLSGELEFFGAGIEQDMPLYHMYQSPDTTWFKERVDEPAAIDAKIVQHSAYVVEISCTTKQGAPCFGTAVDISASRYTEIISEGASHHVDGRTRATLFSNEQGKVRFSVKADSLMAPTFKAHVAEMMGSKVVSIRPDIHTYEKLASAQTTGAELITKGLLDKKHEGKANEIAKALRESAKLALKKSEKPNAVELMDIPEWKSGTPYLNGLEVFPHEHHDAYQCAPDYSHEAKSWELKFGANDEVSFRLLSDSVLETYALDAIPVSKTIWGSLGNLFRFVKNKIKDAARFVVKAVTGGFKLLVEIAGKVIEGVAKTIQQIGNFIELILERVAEMAAKATQMALNWLKELFGWDDILRTKDVFVHLTNSFLLNIEKNLAGAEHFAAEQFDKVDHFLRTELDKAIDFVEGNNTSLRGLVGNARGHEAIGVDPLRPLVLQKHAAANQVRAGYVNGLAEGYYRNQPKQSNLFVLNSRVRKEIEAFIKNFIDKDWPTIKDDVEKLWTYFKKFAERPEEFFTEGLSFLLNLIKTALSTTLKITKNLVVALLKIIKLLVSELRILLNKPLHIPVLSKLYETITTPGNQLSFLDLFCLGAAFPITIAYKAVGLGKILRRGKAPFTEVEVQAMKNWQVPFPNVFGKSDLPQASQPSPIALTVLNSIAGLLIIPKIPLDATCDMIGRIENELTVPTPTDPVSTFFKGAQLVNGCLIGALSAPYADFPKFGRELLATVKTVAFVGDCGGALVSFLSLCGLKIPHVSDLSGITGTLTAIPHLAVGIFKIGKENVFSVLSSFNTAAAGPLPFTVRSSKTDPKFIIWGVGLLLGGLTNGASIGLTIGDSIMSHLQESEVDHQFA